MTTTADHGATGLETGWRPDTPPDDTVLRQYVLASVDAWTTIADSVGGRVERNDRFVAVDCGRPSGIFDNATLLRPVFGSELDETLAEIDDSFAHEGMGDALVWTPWPTPDLTARGWCLEGHPPLLWHPVAPCPVVGEREDLTIVEAADAADVEVWWRTVVEGFPFDDVEPHRRGSVPGPAILDDDRVRLLIGSYAGEAVCAAAQFVHGDQNMLLLAATRPETRRRGFYRAMAAYPLADRPDLPATAVVSDMSRPLLVDVFGFAPLCRLTLWTIPRPLEGQETAP